MKGREAAVSETKRKCWESGNKLNSEREAEDSSQSKTSEDDKECISELLF